MYFLSSANLQNYDKQQKDKTPEQIAFETRFKNASVQKVRYRALVQEQVELMVARGFKGQKLKLASAWSAVVQDGLAKLDVIDFVELSYFPQDKNSLFHNGNDMKKFYRAVFDKLVKHSVVLDALPEGTRLGFFCDGRFVNPKAFVYIA